MVGMRLEPGMSSPNRIDLRLPNCREGCSLPATSVPTPAVAWPIATSQQEELHPTPGVEGAAIDILVPFTSTGTELVGIGSDWRHEGLGLVSCRHRDVCAAGAHLDGHRTRLGEVVNRSRLDDRGEDRGTSGDS